MERGLRRRVNIPGPLSLWDRATNFIPVWYGAHFAFSSYPFRSKFIVVSFLSFILIPGVETNFRVGLC
jgi:hypothetical protein